ncbi:MAG: mycofactocin biosynthesis glycosyltransferase MftF [Thermodesulfobacteriota bacterium]|nr:mycofactocin biosynthesis glycosyltransferase MftF [Thermodesulfobacteriota bacterium]
MRKGTSENQDFTHLAYRMRRPVNYHERNGSCVLVLNYPLKGIVIHNFWGPVFEHLSKGGFISFKHIASLVNHTDPKAIEIFLNGLVNKGFLEQIGFAALDDYPHVSIIIPVRNRPDEITTCLYSLSQLDYPEEKREIIVVDDASDDHTPDAVSRFPVNLISLKEHKQASFCRNLAAGRARGDILAFIDSDCRADPLWLKELVPAFRDPSLGALGGMVDTYFNEKGLDRYEKDRSSLNLGPWSKSTREGDPFLYVPSCNFLVRRDLFLRMAGFREDLHVGEDVDFCWRLQDKGRHIEYRPVGRVYHKHRNRIIDFCARRFDYGTSEPLLQHLHKNRIKHLLLPPAGCLFWGLAILSIIFSYMPLFGLCGIIVIMDSLAKLVKIREKDIPVTFARLVLTAFRSYFSFFYHCCAFVSRYYLFWSILILPILPTASTIILGMHLLKGIVEYFIKKPRLNLPLFLFYFSLDQLSYQLGVWWGCLKGLYFSPINPRIIGKTTWKKT